MSLLDRIQSGAQGLYGFLDKLHQGLSPGMQPINDPVLEELAGPDAAKAARAQAQRAYIANRSQAINQGASLFDADAMAAQPGQEAYMQTLMRGSQAVDALRKRRQESGRLAAFQEFLQGIADPKERAMAEMAPDQFADAAIKARFAPESENFQGLVLSNGKAIILDRRDGSHKQVDVGAVQDRDLHWLNAGDKWVGVDATGAPVKEYPINMKPGQGADDQIAKWRYADSLSRKFEGERGKLGAAGDFANSILQLSLDPNITKNAPAQIAMIMQFGKLLDPDSVTREAEAELIRKARGVFDSMNNLIPQLESGIYLTPTQIKQMTDIARSFQGKIGTRQRALADHYAGLGQKRGIEAEEIIGGYLATSDGANMKSKYGLD